MNKHQLFFLKISHARWLPEKAGRPLRQGDNLIMNRNVLRLITVITILIGTLGMYVPGRATSPTALTSGGVVNIAHFFKPPNIDAATAARTFGTIILTNGDHDYRNQLSANGYSSTIPQYFRSDT